MKAEGDVYVGQVNPIMQTARVILTAHRGVEFPIFLAFLPGVSPMFTRRALLLAAALLAAPAAYAFDIQPYDAAKAKAAIASGKPVVIHVYAPWCLQCHAQETILDGLKTSADYKSLVVYRVDYDNQKDIVADLKCPRATVIGYHGGKEVKRMSWGMSQDAVEEVLKAAL